MTRKLLMTIATAIALIASTGSGTSAAGGGGVPGGFIHGGVSPDRGVHHEVARHHFVSRPGFPATGLGYDDLTGYGAPDAAAEAAPIADSHSLRQQFWPWIAPRNDRGRGRNAWIIVLAECSLSGDTRGRQRRATKRNTGFLTVSSSAVEDVRLPSCGCLSPGVKRDRRAQGNRR
jgi:hypothetical protein